MSARAKAPKAVEAAKMWAIILPDGKIRPWLLYEYRAAALRNSKGLVIQEIARVLITPAPRRRKP
jgi:hypothetical protein